jgi:hypothetical protein
MIGEPNRWRARLARNSAPVYTAALHGNAMKTLLTLILLCGVVFAEDDPPLDQCVADPSHATYRIFQTRNIWTFLKLDTRLGLVWQAQWGDNAVTLPVNSVELVKREQAKAGRFTLCPTRNLFNFILLDQEDGRMWDVQWNQKDDARFMTPLFVTPPEESPPVKKQ